MFRKDKQVKLPKYSIGDNVRVGSRERISQGLDSFNRLDGCLMMDQMWEFCGQGFKILKVVNNFFDERQYKMYKVRSPFYILEGLICNGMVDSFPERCDRSCYLLWHEKWLEKI